MTSGQSAAELAMLSGAQKAAVVLMQMSPDSAAAVMAQFSESEAEDIAAEIVRLRRVSPAVADQVMGEFHDIAVSGRRVARGGQELAVGLLEASFGADKAAGFMDRLASTMAGKSFEFLEVMDSGQILALIDSELPQTIALVLAHLRPAKASAVMTGLGDAQRSDVARCIAVMGSPTPEAVGIVAETLKKRSGAVVSQGKSTETVGGIQPLVDIINRSDVATERSVLDGLETLDPALATEVRARMLTFVDIVKLERRDIQQILRGVPPEVLAVAMKGAPAVVLEAVRTNVSGRNQEILEAEMANAGPVRASQVEEARADIVKSIRELEASGAIVVRRGEEDDLVY
ncbi:flagellar motor switch protein FliG [Pseudarthrobacter enclensis]|uniref:flagellar motor switch protein FliG n=1 Tax=Pseudarthrobacter enclensis TaxID=993070 RepID=UPI00342E9864